MPSKPKRPKRPKINCQYLTVQLNPIRFLRRIEGEFPCPGCGSVVRQGKVFYCDVCAAELCPCCHPDFSEAHRHHPGHYTGYLGDYLQPIICTVEGRVRCMCCDRMLCLTHSRKAEISRLSLKDWRDNTLCAVVLCPNCKKKLDPEPEPESSPIEYYYDPCGFATEHDLREFLGQNGFNE